MMLMSPLGNVAVDALGVIPLSGDIADMGWRANRRNLALRRADLAARGRTAAR